MTIDCQWLTNTIGDIILSACLLLKHIVGQKPETRNSFLELRCIARKEIWIFFWSHFIH